MEACLRSIGTCSRCKAVFLGGIELDFLNGIVSSELFEKLWQTEYREDRTFFSCFYHEIQNLARNKDSFFR